VNSTYRTLVSLAVPVAVLAAAFYIAGHSAELPASLAGLRVYGAYVVIALGIVVSLAFGRGRALFAVVCLAISYLAYGHLLHYGLKNFPARTALAALCIFVPLNLGTLSVLRERGVFNVHGFYRIAAIMLQIAVTLWVMWTGMTSVTDWAYRPLLRNLVLSHVQIPQLGLFLMTAGFIVSTSMWYMRRSAIDLSLATAIALFAIATNRIGSPDAFAVFTGAGTLILTIAVLQDTFRMAFHDELTGLPSRRALNEHLAGLGRRYVIAMLDADHFKDFNDTYGHALGDRVLKMIAARLARVGGGGKAYRYGGEEFTLVFPGKNVEQVMPYLQALRRDIAGYEMALRDRDRRARDKSGRKSRGRRRADNTVSVTISIGVAERNDRLASPPDVIDAADKALYRAKNKGRNQVSR